ncbi:621_t:CDS:2, partial [Acaulospora colombiana]
MKTLTTPEGKTIQTPSAFPMSSSPRFPSIPTLDEWSDMWKLWDTVTLGMISPEMMMQRPIDLRHKCLFYLGHIPTLESGELETKGVPIRKAKRVLWMTFEHEAFHVEKAGEEGGTRPPPGIVPPDWESLQQKWQQRQNLESKEEPTVTLGPAQVEIGHNDFEADDLVELQSLNDDHEFGWDNEHPRRKVAVEKFKIERKPVSNGEYYLYWSNLKDQKDMPASWVSQDGQIMARTLFGPVPLSVARDWPLMASYDELNGYARSKGGRIPTEAELRLFMDDQSSRGDSSSLLRSPSLGNPTRNEAPHNGGVWEWSSTIMDRHQGYESSILYPGYSSDFFDG